nr:MAG TPA: hypothetical protein [Caudoviricetes sp.]
MRPAPFLAPPHVFLFSSAPRVGRSDGMLIGGSGMTGCSLFKLYI